MAKIIPIFAIIPMFLVFSPSAFAARDFDYYFGSIFVPSSAQININTTNTSQNNPSSAQIATMQANLNQIRANLAALNSNLAKPNKVAAVSRGIPLVLEEEKEKTEEKDTLSIFASLIPPDVKNFPLITTYLVVLTLALLGIIIYLFFIRRQEKLRAVK